MTFLEAYVMFGIPLMLLALGGAALLWYRWEDHKEREREQRTPGE
ncbi:MAG: hypothetical protein ACRED5_12070 [Propylenella sp.]